MLIKIYSNNPSDRELDRVVKVLNNDGVIIYPTDSVYAFGCSLRSPKAIEKLRKIKGKDISTLSIVFESISGLSEYCNVDNLAFKTLKQNLPGPFTFILNTLSSVPDKALEKRKTVGVRIPENVIARIIVERLGVPLLTTSVKEDSEQEYTTDPELIYEKYGDGVDLVIDGGFGDVIPTTVVDLTDGDLTIVREGKGELK